jgi:hypothetical protein
MMNAVFRIICSCAYSVTAHVGPSQRPLINVNRSSPHVTLSVGVAKRSYRPDEPVGLSIHLINRGQSAVRLADGIAPLGAYSIEVTRDGKSVPLTAFGLQSLHRSLHIVHDAVSDLQPGQETVSQIDLTRTYDLTLTGVYRVTVQSRFVVPVGSDNTISAEPVLVVVDAGAPN